MPPLEDTAACASGRKYTLSCETLMNWVEDARRCSIELLRDLTDEQLMGEPLEVINPLLWELGHVAWFQEKWVLRHALGRAPIWPDVDRLYDSASVKHDHRWSLPLPTRKAAIGYANEVLARTLEALEHELPSERLAYFVQYAVYHEDMHTEAFTYTRQTLGYPAPGLIKTAAEPERDRGIVDVTERGDVTIDGGSFELGASDDGSFVFDNEKWAHVVHVRPFAISRTAVTQAEYAAFVDDHGYKRREFWSDDGWRWHISAGAEQPVYWQRDRDGGWLRREFDQWHPLEESRPMIHVNWYEADAWCRWAGRRLPSEEEWEWAASVCGASPQKRRFPWGDQAVSAVQANMDWNRMGTLDVHLLADGDSAAGCRQMIGNVWEWTGGTFRPYPGFIPDHYREYSQPWFGTHKVLRGGCWATRSRLIRNTWRNYYKPDRRDIFAGFRTCAVE